MRSASSIPCAERERREQDRHRALEAAPGDECTLAVTQPARQQQRPDDSRPDQERERGREHDAVDPQVAVERRDRDRQAERDENDDLGQRGERLVEDLALGLERARGRRRRAAPRRRRRGSPSRRRPPRRRRSRPRRRASAACRGPALGSENRVQPRARARARPQRRPRDRPPSAVRTRARRSRRSRRDGREFDHADHQRDPDRVVRARLSLQDRPRPPADLAISEHREHDGRVGGATAAPSRPAAVQSSPIT